MSDLSRSAVSAALDGDWDKAVSLNLEILKDDPKNLDSLNRLSRAYLELGKPNKAREAINLILAKIDPYNPIALKNKQRLATIKNRSENGNEALNCVGKAATFIEEPGKTKTVSLINLAPQSALTHLSCGQTVILTPRHHGIHVCDLNDRYLGSLPDDIGRRLNILLKAGNTYEAYIKGTSKNSVAVFVRETARGKRFPNTPSFSSMSADYFLVTLDEEEAVKEKTAAKPEEETVSAPETSEEDSEEHLTAKTIHQDEDSEESA